jgi:hypothetical protein
MLANQIAVRRLIRLKSVIVYNLILNMKNQHQEVRSDLVHSVEDEGPASESERLESKQKSYFVAKPLIVKNFG